MLEVFGVGRPRIVLFVHGFNDDKTAFLGDSDRHFFSYLQTDPAVRENFDWGQYIYQTGIFGNSPLSVVARALKPDADPLRTIESLESIAEHFVSEFVDLCESYEKIVLIGHSLGGLIIKLLLTRLPKGELQRVAHFVTLATPHLGIPSISLGRFGRLLGNRQISDLASYSSTLRELGFQWEEVRHFVPHTFLFGIHDTAVPRKLSVPRNDEENCIPVEADHFSICRPKGLEDEVVSRVRRVLLSSLTNITWEHVDHDTLKDLVADYAQKEGLANHSILAFTGFVQVRDGLLQQIAAAGVANQTILVAVTATLTDRHLAMIISWSSRKNVNLIVWDKRDLEALAKSYPEISIRRNLVAVSPTDVPKTIPQRAMLALSKGDLINRQKERRFISDFLDSEDAVLWLIGIAGVGKSVLTADLISSSAKHFVGIGVFRFSEHTHDSEILKFLNDTFLSIGSREFQILYGNSKLSDHDRIEMAVKILRTNRLLIVLDNFEVVQNASGECTIAVLAKLIEALCEQDSPSKIIVTTRLMPNQIQRSSFHSELLELKPFDVSQCQHEYIPSLQRLSEVVANHADWNSSRIHAVTGGIPLALNLLDAYLATHSFDQAYQISVEKFQAYLVGSIMDQQNESVTRTLRIIALLDGAAPASLFEFLELSPETISVLTRSPILQYNSKERCYMMHASICDAICSQTDAEQSATLHLMIASFLRFQNSDLHPDDKSRHFDERRRVLHLMNASRYEDAAELLGRIGTRFLSFNSVDGLRALINRLKSKGISLKARAWLLNVEAHIGDFSRSFDETRKLYNEMNLLAAKTRDTELISLARSNFGTTKRRRGDFASALRYYWSAYRIAAKNQHRKMMGSTLNNIGQTYMYMYEKSGEYGEQAVKVFERAIQVRNIENDQFRIAATYFHYGNFYIMRYQRERRNHDNWLEQGYALLRRSLELQVEQENFWNLDRTYEALAKYGELSGQTEKQKYYQTLAKDQKLERDIYVSPRFH